MLAHSVQRPPYSIGVFTFAEMRKVRGAAGSEGAGGGVCVVGGGGTLIVRLHNVRMRLQMGC